MEFELTVNDGNGHTATDTVSVVVKDVAAPPPETTNYTIKGFYPAVDMKDANGKPIVNTIKSGKSAALKFEVFDQNNVEQTSTDDVIQSFKQNTVD